VSSARNVGGFAVMIDWTVMAVELSSLRVADFRLLSGLSSIRGAEGSHGHTL